MADHSDWSFTLSLHDDSDDGISPKVPQHVIDAFCRDGFAVFPNVLDSHTVGLLQDRLEKVLLGHYDTGTKPDKAPRISSNHNIYQSQRTKVLQVINIQKADHAYRRLACHAVLGQVIAQLTGWKNGVRLGQDQVWAKSPGAPRLTFHRDAPYFMFEPKDVVTVWVALDDMDAELGPLEYVVQSHKWGNDNDGRAKQFFGGGKSLLKAAAEKEKAEIEIVSMRGLRAGGISIHHGRTWHGSGSNQSKTRPRRGLGLHFVPANVKFTAEASKSQLWKRYVQGAEDPVSVELPEEDFPIAWVPTD